MYEFFNITLVIYGDKQILEQFYENNKMSGKERNQIMRECANYKGGNPINYFYIPVSTKAISFYKAIPINTEFLATKNWDKYTLDKWGTKRDAMESFHHFTNNYLMYFFIVEEIPNKWFEVIKTKYNNLQFVMNVGKNYQHLTSYN